MADMWHDINEPGFIPEESNQQPSQQVTGPTDDAQQVKDEEQPEVRLVSSEWKPGPEGFAYKEKCSLEVKAEYLKETFRARIRGQFYGIYNNEEVDLRQELVGFINKKTGIATMDIKHLWYIYEEFFKAWQENPNTPCQYIVKGIYHTKGENELDSPKLEMPRLATITISLDIFETPDLQASRNDTCILFSSDDNGESFKQEVSLETEGEQLIRIEPNKLKILFKEVKADKNYSCYLDIGEANGGKGHKSCLFYNKLITEQYAYTGEV